MSPNRSLPARSRALLRLLLPLLVLALGATGARAQLSEGELERSVKAAYLYKFLSYVEWPAALFPSPSAPVNIGVLGADDLAAELEGVVSQRTLEGRPIVVTRVRRGEPLGGLHVLYVGRGEATRMESLASTAQSLSILTVTDADGALARGSVINFVRVGANLRFEISLDAAERSALRLSSRLLALATSVRTGPF